MNLRAQRKFFECARVLTNKEVEDLASMGLPCGPRLDRPRTVRDWIDHYTSSAELSLRAAEFSGDRKATTETSVHHALARTSDERKRKVLGGFMND